jgi:hypothetical protein
MIRVLYDRILFNFSKKKGKLGRTILTPVERKAFKKNFGAFYTPNELASELTHRAIEGIIATQFHKWYNISLSLENLLNSQNIEFLKAVLSYIPTLTVLDGSIGQGEFIITSYDALCCSFDSISKRLQELGIKTPILPKERIQANLYGMELDSDTLISCRNVLNEYTWDINKQITLEWTKRNIVQGNFLESDFTSWKSILKDFTGFDLVIGNPPWGSHLTKEERTYYYDKFDLSGSKRNLNSFELFLYQSTNFLKLNDGYLALYLPKNLARSNQYVNLREFILNNYHLKSLIFHDLFEEVTQEFISLFANFTEDNKLNNKILINQQEEILQKIYLTNTDYIFTQITDGKSFQLLNLIKKDTKPLDEYVTIQRGEELSKKGGVMYCDSCALWVPLSSRKPNIECPQCNERLDKNHISIQFLINPNKSSEHLTPILTGDDFDQYLIKSYHYFNNFINFKSKKNKEIYKSPKIVVQKIKQSPCAAIDLKNTLTTQNVYNIRLKTQWQSKPSYLYYILAILNSRLMNWYYEKQFNLGSKYTNAISIKNLKRIPVRPPEENEATAKSIEESLTLSPPSDEYLHILREEIEGLILDLYDCSSYNEFL